MHSSEGTHIHWGGGNKTEHDTLVKITTTGAHPHTALKGDIANYVTRQKYDPTNMLQERPHDKVAQTLKTEEDQKNLLLVDSEEKKHPGFEQLHVGFYNIYSCHIIAKPSSLVA